MAVNTSTGEDALADSARARRVIRFSVAERSGPGRWSMSHSEAERRVKQFCISARAASATSGGGEPAVIVWRSWFSKNSYVDLWTRSRLNGYSR